MEDKILQIIAYSIIYVKAILIAMVVVLGIQFIVYQASGHKINPLKWVYGKMLNLILKVANYEI